MSSVDGYSFLKGLNPDSAQEEVLNLYKKWAMSYDKDTNYHGYVAHKTCSDSFEAEMKLLFQDERFGKKILDAGAGTGFVGQHLRDLGYTNVDALDISQEMLNVARDKGLYKKLICAPISENRIEEIETGCYDALISSGTITIAHVKPPALDEIIRLVKPGGIICFTLRQDAYDTESIGYKKKMDDLTAAKKWKMLNSKLIDYHTDFGQRSELGKCYVFSFKVLSHE